MTTPTIEINQVPLVAGTPGSSRSDLQLATPVVCTDPANGAGAYSWALEAPVGSSSVLSGGNTSSATFVPDIRGTYLLFLDFNADKSYTLNADGRKVSGQGGAAVRMRQGVRPLGTGETFQFSALAGWASDFHQHFSTLDAIDKVRSAPTGTTFYSDSSGDIARLAPGVSGQILQSGGTGAPSWANQAGTTLQSSYDGGAAILTSGAGAVAISRASADSLSALSVTRMPPSAQAGSALSVIAGPNSTGPAMSILNSGIGLALLVTAGGIGLGSAGGADPVVSAGTVDPSIAPGIASPEGSLFLRYASGSGESWTKSGAANTEWTRLGGGGSLDTAYDLGGPGIGRSIIVDSGPVDFTANAIGISETAAIAITNATAATAVLSQNSPMMIFEAQGWKTAVVAGSKTVLFSLHVATTQGSAAPTGDLVFSSSVDGAAYSDVMRLSNAGVLSIPSHFYTGSGQHVTLSSDHNTYLQSPINNMIQTIVGTINVQEMFTSIISNYVPLQVRRNAIGTAELFGLRAYNASPAAAGAQQNSPMITWEGHGWKTDAVAASQPVLFSSQIEISQGTAAPDADLVFRKKINTNASARILSIGDSMFFGNTATLQVGPDRSSGYLLLGNSGNTGLLGSTTGFGFYISSGQWHQMRAGYYDVNSAIDSAAAPVIRINSVNAGIFNPAPSQFAISTAQTEAVRWTAAQNMICAGNVSINSATEPTVRALFVDWSSASAGFPVAEIRRNQVGDIPVPTDISQAALRIANTTTATAVADQSAPLLAIVGAAWNSTALASVDATAAIGLVSSAAASEASIAADMTFYSQVGSTAWARTARLTRGGLFYPEAGIVVAGSVSSPGLSFTGAIDAGLSYVAGRVRLSHGGVQRASYDSTTWTMGVAMGGISAVFSADIDAAGGFRRTLDATWIDSPARLTTYTATRDGTLTPTTPDDKGWHVCARSGSVVELSTWASAAVGAGKINFWIELSGDGGVTWASLWGNPGVPVVSMKIGDKVTFTTSAKDSIGFSAGEVLRVRAETDAFLTIGMRFWASLAVEA